MSRRRTRRKRTNPARTIVVTGGVIVVLLLAHLWVIVLLGFTGAAGLALLWRYSHHPQVSNRVTHHAEMTPEQKAQTRNSQRARVIDLGPNATETDRRMYKRDNPRPQTAPPAAADDPPPF